MKIMFMGVILYFSSENSNRVSWCEMPALIGLVSLPHSSPKRVKVLNMEDNTFI